METRPILARIRDLSLTVEQFASLTGYHAVTVYGWGKKRHGRGVQAVPKIVLLILDLWEEYPHKIPTE